MEPNDIRSVQAISSLILATTKRGNIGGEMLSDLLTELDTKVEAVGWLLLKCEPPSGTYYSALAETVSLGRRAARAGRKYLQRSPN